MHFEREMSSVQSTVTDISTLSIKNLGRHSLASYSRGRRSRFANTLPDEKREALSASRAVFYYEAYG